MYTVDAWELLINVEKGNDGVAGVLNRWLQQRWLWVKFDLTNEQLAFII